MVRDCLEKLPQEERVVILARMEGTSCEELAESMGKQTKVVYKLRERGLARLKQCVVELPTHEPH